jgi:LuxR family maltose regulon positive regulatory protein
MQTHLTLGAIAERLYVSRNTVSTQVKSIYRKLGVSSRREAVDSARDIGLLGC